MYCNGRTSEKRDTGLVSRTGYEGDPGERDLKIERIFTNMRSIKKKNYQIPRITKDARTRCIHQVLNELSNAAMLLSLWVRIKAKVAVGVLDSCM